MKTDLAKPVTPRGAEPQVPSFDRRQRTADEGRGGRGSWLDRPSGPVEPSSLPDRIPSGIK